MGGHPCSFPFRGPLHPSDCFLSPSGAPFILQTVFFPLEGPPSSFRPSSFHWGPLFILQTIFFPLQGPPFLLQTVFFPLGAPFHPSEHLLSPGDPPSSFRPSFFPWGNPVHPPEGAQAAAERPPRLCKDAQIRPLRNHHAPFAGMEKTQKPGPMRLASPETVMYRLLVYRLARGSGSLGPFTFSLIILPSFSKSLLILPPSGISPRVPS